ncbi:MAG: helix-turn-helix domain-containing protein [Clostridia bacterium]|nr:helix-turn-helix domain-containing protein [Clostridia bacterium]
MLPFISPRLKTIIDVPKIIHYICLELTPDFADQPEQHDFWEIVYLESGSAAAWADGRLIPLSPGDTMFHRPGETHAVQIYDDARLHFLSLQSASRTMQVFAERKLPLTPEMKSLFETLLCETARTFVCRVEEGRNLMRVRDDAPFGGQQLCRLYLETFLLQAAREILNRPETAAYDSREAYEEELFSRITALLEEHLYTGITTEELCETMNYSRTYLSVLFRRYAGTSIMQYYNMLKIREAKRLMETCSVTEIAEKLGFCTPYYFSRVFRKFEGIPPSVYKKKMS